MSKMTLPVVVFPFFSFVVVIGINSLLFSQNPEIDFIQVLQFSRVLHRQTLPFQLGTFTFRFFSFTPLFKQAQHTLFE